MPITVLLDTNSMLQQNPAIVDCEVMETPSIVEDLEWSISLLGVFNKIVKYLAIVEKFWLMKESTITRSYCKEVILKLQTPNNIEYRVGYDQYKWNWLFRYRLNTDI